MKALDKARIAARRAQESLYEGRCTVTEFVKVKDPITKITKQQEIIVIENQPCRISIVSAPSASQSETVDNVRQVIKLFLAPEVVVHPGSKVTVTQCGRTTDYECSGQAAMYATHQEILLELYEGRA